MAWGFKASLNKLIAISHAFWEGTFVPLLHIEWLKCYFAIEPINSDQTGARWDCLQPVCDGFESPRRHNARKHQHFITNNLTVGFRKHTSSILSGTASDSDTTAPPRGCQTTHRSKLFRSALGAIWWHSIDRQWNGKQRNVNWNKKYERDKGMKGRRDERKNELEMKERERPN
jgi:hypothetical protein